MKRKRRAAAPLRRGPAVLLGDGCLLLLVLAGTVFSFLTAFSVQIHALPLLLGCAAAALAFLGLWSLPRRWWALPLALLAAAWLLAVRRLWQPLALGADALRVDVVNTVSASLELGFTLEPALSLPEALWTNCATLLVLLALVPLGALLGLGVVRLRSFWLVFVSSFPFVLLPLCISVTPGGLPLMALVLGWVVPALTSLLARTSPLGAARLNLAALPAAALLLAALSLAMPMDTYQRPPGPTGPSIFTNQAVRLGDGLLEGSGPFGIGSGGGRLADADGSVSLSDAGPLRFSGRTVLEVETDLTGRIYLRGLSDAVYDGESWQPLDEAAYNWQARLRDVTYGAPVTLDMDLGVTGAESLFAQFQPMNFPALAVRDAHPGSPYARITVRNVGADPGYVYVPYHILTQPGELSGAEFVHDAYLARAARVWTHTIYVQPDASPAASAGLRGELSLAEAAYADFVREYYLQVPLYSENPALRQALDGALEPLADWLRQAQYVSPAAVKQPYELEAAQVVADYLAAVAEYDPDTPAAPEGEDFVAWFLTESHRGYCMHFASAAVLLLRSIASPPAMSRLCGRRACLRACDARLRRPRPRESTSTATGGSHGVTPSTPGTPGQAARARGHPSPTPQASRALTRRAHPPHAVGGPPGMRAQAPSAPAWFLLAALCWCWPSCGAFSPPPPSGVWDETPTGRPSRLSLSSAADPLGSRAARPGRGAGPQGQIQPPHPHRRGAGRGAPRRPRRGRGGGQVPPLVEAVRLPLSAGAVLRSRLA
ncbi:MAG: transglutaminase domain-containing protein [Flavonifractor plautii]